MKNILMIGTGGTIASEMTPEGLTPELNSKQLLSFVPKIGEMCHVDCIQVYSLDSTNIRPADWLGVADILLYIRVERFTGFGPIVSLVSGALSVMTGVMLLVYPNAGKWVMSLLFPLWFLTHCISNLTHLNWVRLTAGRVNYTISLVLNILGIVLATLMLLHPVLSAVSMSLTIGFYLILLGVDGIVLALSSMGR